ncbi:MAG: AsmA-like C-terminal region-containing protein [Desulfobacterales bacterium]|jgi:translocation and assembly module TamB
MKKKPLLIGTAIAAFFIIFAGLVFLPAVLSSELLKPRILQAVNERLPGKLQLERWRFKWFSGIEAKGITYDQQEENVFIEVAELKGYRGLVQLITNARNLGGVEIIRPQVLFYISDRQPPEVSKKAEPSQAAGLPAIAGILKITDGSIRTVDLSGKEKTVVKDLDLFLDVSDIEKPITYRVLLTSGDSIGRFAGEGTLTLAADNPLDLSAIQSEASLKVTNWELEDTLAILASQGNYPYGKGRLNADMKVQGSSAEALNIKGNLSIKRLELWGGPLKTDHPRFKNIATELDANITQGSLSLQQLNFKSSVAQGTAKGSVSDQGDRQFSGSASVNLVEIFSQLPQTFKLRRDTNLSEGTLVMSYDVKSTETVTAFDSSAKIDRLKGASGGKAIAWNQPISLKARGVKRPDGIELDQLSLRSAFVNADGQGDLTSMKGTLSADLAAAIKELKKFVAIREWNAAGKLFARFDIKETAPDINAASLNLDIRKLALSRNGRTILPQQDAKADVTTTVRRAASLSASQFQQPNLSVQSTLAKGNFRADHFQLNDSGKMPSVKNLNVDAKFNLQQISEVLRNFNILPATTRLAGNAHLQTNGTLDSQQLTLNSTHVDTRNFQYHKGENSIHEERLTLQTKGRLNFATRSAGLAPININGSAGTITIPRLTVNDWSNFQKDMKAQAQADLDLAKLFKAYGDFIELPEKTKVAGKGKVDLDVDFSSPTSQFLKVRADLSPFQLTSDTLPPIAEDRVKLIADLKRKPDGSVLTIENIQLNSTPLSLSAAGNLNQAGRRKKLDAAGSIKLDLKMLSPYLEKIAGPQQITITGKGNNPFQLKMVSGGQRWTDSLRQTDFSGAIHAESIDAFGLGISTTEIPIRVANESALAKLVAAANGGQIDLQPTLNLQKEPYMLTLPQDTHILKDVEITDAMAERLMSKIHPVFQGSVQADGRVDLYMQHFSWPLDNKFRDKTDFAGTLRLRGVRIKSTKMLTGILALMGVRGNEMDFEDLDIDFVARNGRIETSPIRLEIDGYPIALHGSVGFDRSLDYVAKIPITPKLVGDKAYTYLEGVTIDVPIRGDSSNPDIDQGTAQQASASLVEQALQKSLQKGVQNVLEQLLKK